MGTRKFFEHDSDYLCYIRAEKELIRSERARVARESVNPNFWTNYFGIMCMLLLPEFIWWSWSFKGNPCINPDGSWIRR